MSSSAEDKIVELNVGGAVYASFKSTLVDQYPSSRLSGLVKTYLSKPSDSLLDSKKRLFIDRNGIYSGSFWTFCAARKPKEAKFLLPDSFREISALRHDASYYGLTEMTDALDKLSRGGRPSVITLGYRGTFAFGRDGLADVKFRKLSRILASGRVSACREVFEDTLNMSRDPDCGYPGTKGDRYSSRFFLKHNVLEQAFDSLYSAGYSMVGSCGSGTNSAGGGSDAVRAGGAGGQDSEESKWQHYNEFVFVKL